MTTRRARNAPTLRRRALTGLTMVALTAAAWTLPESDSAFTATTHTAGAVETLTVAPPANVDATMTTNVLPLLTCKVVVSWEASTTPDVTGYEVVRVVASTGSLSAGPWTTTNLSFVDDPVPLQLIGSAFEWRVRTVHSTWYSDWRSATPDNLLACLL